MSPDVHANFGKLAGKLLANFPHNEGDEDMARAVTDSMFVFQRRLHALTDHEFIDELSRTLHGFAFPARVRRQCAELFTPHIGFITDARCETNTFSTATALVGTQHCCTLGGETMLQRALLENAEHQPLSDIMPSLFHLQSTVDEVLRKNGVDSSEVQRQVNLVYILLNFSRGNWPQMTKILADQLRFYDQRAHDCSAETGDTHIAHAFEMICQYYDIAHVLHTELHLGSTEEAMDAQILSSLLTDPVELSRYEFCSHSRKEGKKNYLSTFTRKMREKDWVRQPFVYGQLGRDGHSHTSIARLATPGTPHSALAETLVRVQSVHPDDGGQRIAENNVAGTYIPTLELRALDPAVVWKDGDLVNRFYRLCRKIASDAASFSSHDRQVLAITLQSILESECPELDFPIRGTKWGNANLRIMLTRLAQSSFAEEELEQGVVLDETHSRQGKETTGALLPLMYKGGVSKEVRDNSHAYLNTGKEGPQNGWIMNTARAWTRTFPEPKQYSEAVRLSGHAVLDYFQLSPDDYAVIFFPNAMAVYEALKGHLYDRGLLDEAWMATSMHDYPPFLHLIRGSRSNRPIIPVNTFADGAAVEGCLDEYEHLLQRRGEPIITSAITSSQLGFAPFSSMDGGCMENLPRYCRGIKERNPNGITVVDVSQSLGFGSRDKVDEMDADLIVTSAQKALGVPGVAAAIVRKAVTESGKPLESFSPEKTMTTLRPRFIAAMGMQLQRHSSKVDFMDFNGNSGDNATLRYDDLVSKRMGEFYSLIRGDLSRIAGAINMKMLLPEFSNPTDFRGNVTFGPHPVEAYDRFIDTSHAAGGYQCSHFPTDNGETYIRLVFHPELHSRGNVENAICHLYENVCSVSGRDA